MAKTKKTSKKVRKSKNAAVKKKSAVKVSHRVDRRLGLHGS